MNDVSLFLIGVLLTVVSCFVVVLYLRAHLRRILTDLCGTAERAGFWMAFSNVTLVLVPAVVAMHFRPALLHGQSSLFEIADQLKWSLVGLIGAVLILGIVISRFIRDAETQNRILTAAGMPAAGPVASSTSELRPGMLASVSTGR